MGFSHPQQFPVYHLPVSPCDWCWYLPHTTFSWWPLHHGTAGYNLLDSPHRPPILCRDHADISVTTSQSQQRLMAACVKPNSTPHRKTAQVAPHIPIKASTLRSLPLSRYCSPPISRAQVWMDPPSSWPCKACCPLLSGINKKLLWLFHVLYCAAFSVSPSWVTQT